MPLLGKQSAAARAAAERYKDVPKQGRLDALRPFLIKCRCFPPDVVDYENAPIGIEELKLLVRRWNMHHERNFWRNHPTPDSVAMALYIKLKQKREDAARKAELAKELSANPSSPRHKRGTHGAHHGTSFHHEPMPSPLSSPGKHNTNKHYSYDDNDEVGSQYSDYHHHHDPTLSISQGFAKDLFKKPHKSAISMDENHESYLNVVSPQGLLVMSRTDGTIRPMDPRRLKPDHHGHKHHASTEHLVEENDEEKKDEFLATVDPVDDPKIRVKRKCAAALLNMSLKEQMEKQFADEGGLASLLDLALSTSDRETLTYCMSCILNLAGEGRADSRLFDSEFDIVRSIATLSENSDQRIRQYSAKSLAFFTMLDDIEERLVSMDIIRPLKSLATDKDNNAITRMIACKGLMNISAVLINNTADGVNKVIMDCLTSLTMLDVGFLSSFAAEVIQNLSTLPNARQKIADEGAIDIINTLIRSDANARTMKAAAISLCNLSQLKSCRQEMLEMGVIEVLTKMLRTDNAETVYLCTLALSNLTAQSELRKVVAKEGGIVVLCELLSSTHIKTQAVASKSLANFACDNETRRAVVDSGGVRPMINLLYSHQEGPRHDALGALCNLLSYEDTYIDVINCSIIGAFSKIMHHDMHLEGISLGLLNITTYSNMHMSFVDQGGAALLVQLLLNPDLTYLISQNLSALANIAKSSKTHSKLIKSDIVKALWKPIQNAIPEGSTTAVLDLETASKISSILMYLSTTEDSCKKLVSDGAVLSLVQLSRQNDDNTKLCAAAMFYNLSLKKVLTDHGFLDALIETSNTSINQRVVWCAQTFSNLSTYPRGRSMFGKEIVKVAQCLTAMMRSGCTDAEKIQRHCAIALCNSLSVWLKQEHIEEMVTTGLIQDLIVITVLRVNVKDIKETLAKALFNLLITQQTRALMVEKGIMSSLIRLVNKVSTSEVISLCVTALQNLSCEPKLATLYVDQLLEMNAVSVLVQQAVAGMAHIEVKKMCASALANLSRIPVTHRYFLKEGNLCHALKKISLLRHAEDWIEKSAEVVYNLTKFPDNHAPLLKQNITATLDDIIENGNANCRVLGTCALCNLSASPNAHKQVTDDGMHILIATLKHMFMPMETKLNALVALCNLVVEHEPARKRAVEEDVVPALGIMMKSLMEGGDTSAEDELGIVAKIMREISYYKDGHVTIQDSKGVNILLRLSKLENAEIKVDVATALLNLSTCKFCSVLIEDGAIEAIYWLILQDLLGLTKSVYERCVLTVRNLTTNEKAIGRVVLESKIMVVLGKMSEYDDMAVKYSACISLYNISCYPDSQELFARSNPGIISYLVNLAEQGNERMRSIASAALHQFPQGLLKNDPKIINILMDLLSMDTAILDDCEIISSECKTTCKKGWEGKTTTCEYSSGEVVTSWLNIVAERVLTFSPGRVEGEISQAQGVGGGGMQANLGAGRIVGSFSKMMIEHMKQTSKDFAMPLPGAEISTVKKRDLYKREKEEEEEDEDVLLSMQALAAKREPKTLSDKMNVSNVQAGGIGRGESYDNFAITSNTEMTKLPSLNPPVPPEGGEKKGIFSNDYKSKLMTNDLEGEGSPIPVTLSASFKSNLQKNVPLIPKEAQGIPENVQGSGMGRKSKYSGERGVLRQSFQVSQQKKAVKLENDYKEMLLLKSNNIF